MDKIIKKEVTDLLNLFEESLRVSCTVFDSAQQVVYTTSSNTLSTTILVGNDSFYDMLEQRKNDLPVLFGSSLGSIWISCFDGDGRTYVLGPVLSSELSARVADEALNRYNLSLHLKHEILDYLETIPVFNYNSLYPFAIMLHYVLNQEKISNGDVRLFSQSRLDENNATVRKDRMRTWQAEQRLMKNIEDGNMDYKDSLTNARSISYGMRISTGNPSRQIKNSLLTFVSLSARAAIRGGMTPEMAYTISDAYVERLEKTENINELSMIADQMFEEYISRVHALKTGSRYSKTVQTVIDYIELHIEEELSLAVLSQLSGYTDYYLSRCFRKETGLTVNQYINREKVSRARMLLDTSDLSVKEIAEKLSFASETYFSTVFKKYAGLSPAQYRNSNK